MIEVVKADVLGFCGGVRRAVHLIEAELAGLSSGGSLYTLGAIVHNARVVDALTRKGARVVETLDQVPNGASVAITAHGAGEDVLAAALRRGLRPIDTTCPIVRRAQQEAECLSREGFAVVVYGEASHPEVRGLLSWARGNGMAALLPDAVVKPGLRGVAAISQTTQSPEAFAQFARALAERFAGSDCEVRTIDTTCPETGRRYQAAAALAREVDVLFVVGGRESANTRRLAEVCRATGVPTYAIQSADEIEAAWLHGVQRAGVTAGASTPDDVIEEVVRRISFATGE